MERTLVKDPDERFPDGAALLSAVEDVLAGRVLAPQPDRHATTVLPVSDAGDEPAPTRPRPAGGGTSPGPRHAASGVRPSRRLLVGLLALLVVAAVAVGLLVGRTDRSPAPVAGPTSAPTSSTTGHLVAGDHLGRPVAEVEAELTGLGLSVQLRPVQTADVPDGQVLAVEPLGELTPGQTVTLTYAVAPVPAPAEGANLLPSSNTFFYFYQMHSSLIAKGLADFAGFQRERDSINLCGHLSLVEKTQITTLTCPWSTRMRVGKHGKVFSAHRSFANILHLVEYCLLFVGRCRGRER